MSIFVRPAQAADVPAIRAILKAEYPESLKSDEGFFRWRFEQNPAGPPLSNYFLAFDGGALVGQLGTIADRVWVKDEWHSCLWLCDLIVKPEYRSGRAALQLLHTLTMAHPLVFFLGVCPHMVDSYKLLGAVEIPVLQTFYSVARWRPLLKIAQDSGGLSSRALKFSHLLGAADFGSSLLQTLRWRLNDLGENQLVIELLESFGSEVEQLAIRLTPVLGNTAWRSSEQMHWKIQQRPFGKHFMLAARDRSTQALKGYILVKLMRRGDRINWAEITDFLTDPGEPTVFDRLVEAAHNESLRLKTDFVRFRLSHPVFLRRLRKPFWFQWTRPIVDSLFVSCRDQVLLSNLKRLNWHLTAMAAALVDYGEDEWPVPPQRAAATR